MDVGPIVAALEPLLPYLVTKTTDLAVGEAIKKAGKETWEFARGLWEKLRPAVEASPVASEAVNDLAARPDDEDYRTVLRVQLKKLLEAVLRNRPGAGMVSRFITAGLVRVISSS